MNNGSNTIIKLMTPDDLSDFLSLSKPTIYRLVDGRKIPFLRISGSLRFRRDDIIKFLEDNRIEPVNL